MAVYVPSFLERLRENSQYFVIITQENRTFGIEPLGVFLLIELVDG